MTFALVWRFDPPESHQDQTPKVLIGHPGTFSVSEDDAKEEGRRILADGQIEPELRQALMPLAVVEVTEDIGDDIQERCEEVEIGTELLFYDLEKYDRWVRHSWWPNI